MTGAGVAELANYGVLGVFAAVLLIFAQRQVRREQDRADRLETRLAAKDDAMQEKVIPALEAASVAVQAATDLLRQFQRDREIEAARRRDGDRA